MTAQAIAGCAARWNRAQGGRTRAARIIGMVAPRKAGKREKRTREGGSAMATFYSEITPEQAALIRNAPLFFVATADPELLAGPNGEGPVNVSPRGGVALHILAPNRVAFFDFVGSGNETGRHTDAGGPITLMICSFDANAAVVRLYGRANNLPFEDSPLRAELSQAALDLKLPPRRVIQVDVERTMTSCGYGVPVMTFEHERRVTERGRAYKAGRG